MKPRPLAVALAHRRHIAATPGSVSAKPPLSLCAAWDVAALLPCVRVRRSRPWRCRNLRGRQEMPPERMQLLGRDTEKRSFLLLRPNLQAGITPQNPRWQLLHASTETVFSSHRRVRQNLILYDSSRCTKERLLLVMFKGHGDSTSSPSTEVLAISKDFQTRGQKQHCFWRFHATPELAHTQDVLALRQPSRCPDSCAPLGDAAPRVCSGPPVLRSPYARRYSDTTAARPSGCVDKSPPVSAR
jgi:hypothetical protein